MTSSTKLLFTTIFRHVRGMARTIGVLTVYYVAFAMISGILCVGTELLDTDNSVDGGGLLVCLLPIPLAFIAVISVDLIRRTRIEDS